MLLLRMPGVVLLLFSVCDADSTCPEELNTLSLDPPAIIEEYGAEVLVNCSNTADESMYWRVGDKNFDPEEEENFLGQSVLLSDWDVRAECITKLNESTECSKELEITIYKNPTNVSLTARAHATPKQTQYEMQCDITDVAPVQNLTVRWYKDDNLIETNSFNDTTKTPVNESSVLTVTVNRGEGEVQIRCEAQLDFGPYGPQLPVISQAYIVSAQYAPELKPGKNPDFIVAKEDDDITLNCEAEGNPPPVFHWTYDGVTKLESSNSLNITRINASKTYTCTASNYLGNTTKTIYVRVTPKLIKSAPAALPTPEAVKPRAEDCPIILTPPEIVVRFGDPASVSCNTTAMDALGMGWEATVGGTSSEESSVVTWMVDKLEDWSAAPTCYINLNGSDDIKQCLKSPTVTVYKTPDTVSVSMVNPGPMMEDEKYHLICDVNNVAPVKKLRVKWYRDNETLLETMFLNTAVTPQNMSSNLTITPTREYNGSLYRCEAALHLGPNGPEIIPTETSLPYIAIVHYEPFIKDCPSRHIAVEHKFSMDMLPCAIGGNPPPTVRWSHLNKLINSSQPLTRTDDGTYTAEVVNSLGRSSTSVEIMMEYKPFFDCEVHYEAEVNAEFQTWCKPQGNPRPRLQWIKNGIVRDFTQGWTKHDSGNYLLKATNKHGEAEHNIHLDILYAPEFQKGNSSEQVSLGENVTLDCIAYGNPTPVIHWTFKSAADLEVTTVWRQNTINITVATSTNTGVYSCVATNKVGHVTRSVTLVMKGRNRGTPMYVIWVLLFVLAIFTILILMVLFHKRQKKQGQYSFVSSNGKDGPNVPMTTMSDGGTT